MIHNYTTLPGHDPSKVRAPDCITASASVALDVLVLQCIETLLTIDRRDVHSEFRQARAGEYARLQTIAAEIRDAATPRRQVPETNDVIAIWTADTATELRDVWSGSSARRPEMEPIERIRLLEKAMGRLLVIEARHEGDGR
tara:strand:+ start:1719 stop:2144 length:426 start_codon:yes stop_codon:yes gene_type:complete